MYTDASNNIIISNNKYIRTKSTFLEKEFIVTFIGDGLNVLFNKSGTEIHANLLHTKSGTIYMSGFDIQYIPIKVAAYREFICVITHCMSHVYTFEENIYGNKVFTHVGDTDIDIYDYSLAKLLHNNDVGMSKKMFRFMTIITMVDIDFEFNHFKMIDIYGKKCVGANGFYDIDIVVCD